MQVVHDDKEAGVTAAPWLAVASAKAAVVIPCGSTAAETIALSDFRVRKAVFKNYGDQRDR
jgi:hypothetical protein